MPPNMLMSSLRTALGFVLPLVMAADGMADATPVRRIMYLTGQHNVVPGAELANDITHVALAFMRSDVFNVDHTPDSWPLFTTVGEARTSFSPETKVMVAIGGWGDSRGFEEGAKTSQGRKRWTRQVNAMVTATGADGIDIDWEYPGGNRDDYKEIPNSDREWEIEAFVLLLEELRTTLGPDKLLSIAVPGCERDLMAFTSKTVPRITKAVDFINVMTYDLMNRRDKEVKHHSGVQDSAESIQLYIDRGASPQQLNFGLGYYVKWFMASSECGVEDPLGCPTQLLEDPDTGADLGKTGAFSWHDPVPEDLAESFARAQSEGRYFADGSYGYLDKLENRWWSFDSARVASTKVEKLLRPLGLGGVFAWGLGEDAPEFARLRATMEMVDRVEGKTKDEL
ncbi:hypothetical protein NLU13_9822 [Sarocladium strictum]|uniref:chitinase n=1 Tax=Sarocladium strictum TaxID=5046 RepID=A0AA39L368_SARSR|nr:hypothetical protein NLU13_9822 [Sarocladium strictum]